MFIHMYFHHIMMALENGVLRMLIGEKFELLYIWKHPE